VIKPTSAELTVMKLNEPEKVASLEAKEAWQLRVKADLRLATTSEASTERKKVSSCWLPAPQLIPSPNPRSRRITSGASSSQPST
jgi:hypothetical protein